MGMTCEAVYVQHSIDISIEGKITASRVQTASVKLLAAYMCIV